MTCYFINNLYICVCVLNKYVVSIDLLLTLCILMNKFPTWIDRRMFAGEDGEIYIFSVGRIFYFLICGQGTSLVVLSSTTSSMVQ